MNRFATFAIWLYARLPRLYPPACQAAFAQEALAIFRLRVDDAVRQGRWPCCGRWPPSCAICRAPCRGRGVAGLTSTPPSRREALTALAPFLLIALMQSLAALLASTNTATTPPSSSPAC